MLTDHEFEEQKSNVFRDCSANTSAYVLSHEHNLGQAASKCFTAVHFFEYLLHADPDNVYFSLEPLDKVYRVERSKGWTNKVKERFGILLDTGAPTSCVGKKFRV